jgi:hypothetical protein
MTTRDYCKVATVVNARRSATELLLAAVATNVSASGARVVGLLAETPDLPEGVCGAGVLRDIVSGKKFSIKLDVVPKGTACQLDAAGVTAACSHVIDQIAASDLVVLSKFGKLESMGLGLTAAFEAAIAARKPLLTSVSRLHRDAWRTFVPDASDIAAEKAAVFTWWESCRNSAEQ